MKRTSLYIVLTVALLLVSSTVLAKSPAGQLTSSPAAMTMTGPFSNASIQGHYALIASVNEGAGIGSCWMDGKGNYTCSITLNVPDGEGGRAIVPLESAGTYQINPDGTGTVQEVVTMADGATEEFVRDLVITEAEAAGPYVVATTVNATSRQSGDGSGALETSQLTRLPDVAMQTRMDDGAKAALAKQFYDAFNAGDLDAMESFIAADFVDNNPIPGQPAGLEGLKWALGGFYAAFPDIQVEPQQILVSGDYVTVLSIATGSQDGEFLGLPPTGKTVQFHTSDTWRIEDGMLVEGFHIEDLLGVLIQLGAFGASQ
jgi:steroid delta-isomerase-like uncharacterized protein